MTPTELKTIRNQLGLTQAGLAALLKVGSGRTVRRWEAGERAIPGPAAVALRLLSENPDLIDGL